MCKESIVDDRQGKLAGHHARNRQLLMVFAEKSVSLDELRLVEFHFWAFEQHNAVELGHELRKRGFELLALKPVSSQHDPECWNIEASMVASISSVISQEFTEALLDLAARFGAEYDGWGTSV